MKKQYQTITIEFEEFSKDDVILASVLGNSDNTITDDFDDLI